MKKLNKNDVFHISRGSMYEGYAYIFPNFEQKYSKLGYEIHYSWST